MCPARVNVPGWHVHERSALQRTAGASGEAAGRSPGMGMIGRCRRSSHPSSTRNALPRRKKAPSTTPRPSAPASPTNRSSGSCATGGGAGRSAGCSSWPAHRTRGDSAVWVAHLATRRAGGLVSFFSAAAVWGILSPSTLPHVTVPPSASAACRAARVHRGTVPSIDRGWRDGLLLTSVSRTTVDLASVLDRQAFESVLDVVLCRRLASVGSIERSIGLIGPRRRERARNHLARGLDTEHRT